MRGFAAMAKIDLSINLLDNKGKKFVDQFLDWAIAIGRLLIIITETVALAAFLYRFSSDRQLVDLNDEIKKSEAIVAYFKSGEDTYRHTQTKLAIAKTQLETGGKTVDFFNTMMQLSQNYQVSYNNITVSDTLMQLAVQGKSTQTLANFVEAIKAQKRVTAVSVDKVENKPSSATIIISLSVTLKPEQGGQPK